MRNATDSIDFKGFFSEITNHRQLHSSMGGENRQFRNPLMKISVWMHYSYCEDELGEADTLDHLNLLNAVVYGNSGNVLSYY